MYSVPLMNGVYVAYTLSVQATWVHTFQCPKTGHHLDYHVVFGLDAMDNLLYEILL